MVFKWKQFKDHKAGEALFDPSSFVLKTYIARNRCIWIHIYQKERSWMVSVSGYLMVTGPQGLFRPAWVHRSSEVDCVKVSETFVNHIPALQSSAAHDFWVCGLRHLHDIHTGGSMWMMSPVAILLAFPASCTRLNTLWLLCHLPKCPEGNLAKGSCLLRFKSRFRMPRFDLVSWTTKTCGNESECHCLWACTRIHQKPVMYRALKLRRIIVAPKRHCPRFEDCPKSRLIDLSQPKVRIGEYLEGKHDARFKSTLQHYSCIGSTFSSKQIRNAWTSVVCLKVWNFLRWKSQDSTEDELKDLGRLLRLLLASLYRSKERTASRQVATFINLTNIEHQVRWICFDFLWSHFLRLANVDFEISRYCYKDNGLLRWSDPNLFPITLATLSIDWV